MRAGAVPGIPGPNRAGRLACGLPFSPVASKGFPCFVCVSGEDRTSSWPQPYPPLRQEHVCERGRLAGGGSRGFGSNLAKRGLVWPPDKFVGIIAACFSCYYNPAETRSEPLWQRAGVSALVSMSILQPLQSKRSGGCFSLFSVIRLSEQHVAPWSPPPCLHPSPHALGITHNVSAFLFLVRLRVDGEKPWPGLCVG